jgi:hypothetical protein
MVRAVSQAVAISPGPPDDDDEKPLDPAIERIRQRLKRLILVSSATLMIGVVAVLAAVIYRIGPVRDKPALIGSTIEASVAGVIPPGGRVISSSLSGTLLALTLDVGGSSSVVVIDLSTNRIVRRLALGSQ